MFSLIPDRLKWLAIRRPATVRQTEGVRLSRRAYVDSFTSLGAFVAVGEGSKLICSSLGTASYCIRSRITNTAVASFTSIGPDTIIGGLASHPLRMISTHPVFYSPHPRISLSFSPETRFSDEVKRTFLGNDVWVGARATVLSGVSVGNGAVLAAGSVVTRDVPPYSIMGGVPAREIGKRFTAEVIAELLDWQWWHLPLSVLARAAESFADEGDWTAERVRSLRLLVDGLRYEEGAPLE